MSEAVLKVDNLSKQYKLGQFGTGTLGHDLSRWWSKFIGKGDPFALVGEENDRSKATDAKYVWALKDINLEVQRGEVLGVIGKNGAGKSTLLKILSQVTKPTVGNIFVKGRIASLLEVGTGFHPELTGKENIYLNGAILGMTRTEITSKLDEIVEFAGVARYLNTPVKRYSSGMKVRLGFAVAAHLEPEILIVDEVLAVGDAEFQRKAIGKMKDVSQGEGRTVLFVSHNLSSIKNLCERTVLMNNGKIQMVGDTQDVVRQYLGGGDRHSDFGIVAPDHERSQYHKGYLRISRVDLLDDSFSIRKNFQLLEPFVLRISIECERPVKDAIFVVSIMNDEFGRISYSSSSTQYQKFLADFEKGQNQYQVTLEQSLLPGNYSFAVSILDEKGYPYDGLQYFGNMTIENYGRQGEHYPWVRPIGTVIFNSKFEKTE